MNNSNKTTFEVLLFDAKIKSCFNEVLDAYGEYFDYIEPDGLNVAKALDSMPHDEMERWFINTLHAVFKRNYGKKYRSKFPDYWVRHLAIKLFKDVISTFDEMAIMHPDSLKNYARNGRGFANA